MPFMMSLTVNSYGSNPLKVFRMTTKDTSARLSLRMKLSISHYMFVVNPSSALSTKTNLSVIKA